MVVSSTQFATDSDGTVTTMDKVGAHCPCSVDNCNFRLPIPFAFSFLLVLMEDGTRADDFLFGVACYGCNDVDDGTVIADMCRAGSYRECYLVVFVGSVVYDFKSMEKGRLWSLWSVGRS